MKCVFRTLLFICALSFIEATCFKNWVKNTLSKPGETGCIPDGSDGTEYRGNVSVTVNGRICAPWCDVPIRRLPDPDYKHISHNHCRNPDHSIKPWCMVRSRRRLVREYCDIPDCKTEPHQIPPTTAEPRKQDTESTCGERNLSPMTYKIIGGTRSVVESQPWIAAIFHGNGFLCGGTLIAPCWVLTAAHCFTSGEKTKMNKYSVFLGKNAINETDPDKEQKFNISQIVIHHDFDYTTENYTHDIALVNIMNRNGQCAMRTDAVRTVCLPPSQQMLPPGSYCDIAGYGRHERGGFEYSRHLKTAQVKLLSQNVCQQKYYSADEVNDNMFCAADQSWEADACQGDSGGPLVCEASNTMFLFGIISWGKECAKKFNPGVYTKVTNYNQWISKHTGLPLYTAGSRYPQKDKR